ncbi:carcinoembryonic antigen-related cell adhesion molecule 1 isoform X1 [Pangasianodon hypophthalmus]|uniref:carcinoembryonic antigen-related cell adhesion molecule 1 isoform X1 n=1 Tax=Pangasianodon hypophthalmus TaxID=310915 RepID=UPI00230754A9|nr:carcinoembryonic antigen-related cell adhesion molecule 1 isoform X1 [Pangasianodon hypophthalmus]
MEKAMVVTLIITLLTGFSQEQNILPPGPINKEVGANVLFTIISSPEPVHAIRWHFNGSEVIRYIPPGPEIVNSDYRGRVFLNYSSGDLELKGLSMNDSGQYTIILTFQSGLGVQDHTLLQVFEPVFVISITSPEGNLIEYSSANFTCEGNGTISTTVWMKEYEILAPSSSIQFLDDNRTMVISPVKRSDSGNYQCAMSNPVSSSSAHYSITVNYGPDVRIFGAQTLEEGSDILLLCSPDSVPPATITWTVKGMSTRSAALYVTENSNPSDSGDYNCTCWNNVTGITASAVQVLTVRAVSSRLGPGVETGITLGVIAVVLILVVVIYFLIKRSKKPAKAVRETPVSMTADQQTDVTSGYNNMVAETLKRSKELKAGFTYHTQNGRSSPPLYENQSQTTPARRNRPPLPQNRETNDSELYCSAIVTSNN